MKTLQPGSNTLIVAPTDSGKSYLFKKPFRNFLIERNLKCSFLVPRTAIKKQFEAELPDDANIHFSTYQAFENSATATLSEYDVIVCDEAHYPCSDVRFNDKTDVSFNKIIRHNQAIKIFMSATPGCIERYFIENRIPYKKYCFQRKYENINNLQFFYSDDYLEAIADEVIASSGKGAFILNSARTAYQLHKKYEDCSLFVCSKGNEPYSRYVDDTLVEKMLQNDKFETTLLFATRTLDCGVSFRDSALTTMVIDLAEPDSIIQALGRKRRTGDNDHIKNLYIKARTTRQIHGYIRSLQKKIDNADDFWIKGEVEYTNSNHRRNDNSGMVIDVPVISGEDVMWVKEVYKLMYSQVIYDIIVYRDMLGFGKDCHAKYIATLLGKENDYTIIEDIKEKENLIKFLDGITGNPMLTVADRKTLIEMINVRQNGRLCRTFNVLSAWLEDSGLPFRLETSRKTQIIDGKRRDFQNVWEIVKLSA